MTVVQGTMRRLAPIILAGTLSMGGIGCAMAGADDGGARSFWNVPAPGSAGGTPETATPGTVNPAAAAQPNASISRTGVAQDGTALARPRVAVTRTGREQYAVATSRTRVNVVRHEVRPTKATAERRPVQGRGVLHALHRSTETNSQS